jgi:hypothetical protein
MTHEEKINYMRIAAGICSFGFRNDQLDLLVSLYELILKKKGKSNVEDALNVEHEVKNRADTKAKQDLLDKVSDKKD